MLNRQAKNANVVAKAGSRNRIVASNKRARSTARDAKLAFAPPEDWHEPTESHDGYRVVVQTPGDGYHHVVTPEEIRERLLQLPASFIEPLEVVQLSRMTRKKRSFPCYGMQWGTALYLYPLENTLEEQFDRAPRPVFYNEAKMYGGRWVEERGQFRLVWTEATIKDFYLNNILIHELGHLLDQRNTSYAARERYAEWFAIEYGYRASNRPARKISQRHAIGGRV